MECSINMKGDYAVVRSTKAELGTLKFDMTVPCCRIFETAKQQSRDYLEELIEWCGEAPENYDALAKSIHMQVLVRRREAGLK